MKKYILLFFLLTISLIYANNIDNQQDNKKEKIIVKLHRPQFIPSLQVHMLKISSYTILIPKSLSDYSDCNVTLVVASNIEKNKVYGKGDTMICKNKKNILTHFLINADIIDEKNSFGILGKKSTLSGSQIYELLYWGDKKSKDYFNNSKNIKNKYEGITIDKNQEIILNVHNITKLNNKGLFDE